MKRISLHQAVSEISQQRRASRRSSPFIFIIGAGVSAPSIPLSGDIVRYCRRMAKRRGVTAGPPEPVTPMSEYSYWFEKAFSDREGRRNYLEELIRDKPISMANLKLAQILGSGKIANTLVTPSFDDQLLRALSFLGYPFVECDHPAIVGRVDPSRTSPLQSVFVHGRYWFYDCSNLEGEIRRSAAKPVDPLTGMPNLLDALLRRQSPIVVGYAGWDGDTIMSALRRRMSHPLGRNLYWFCYKDSEADNLPSWLTKNDEVRLISPSTLVEGSEKGSANRERLTGETDERSSTHEARATRSDALDLLLPAADVFSEMIDVFRISEPAFLGDPLGFFTTRLEAEFLGRSKTREVDPIGVTYAIERIERARKWSESERAGQLKEIAAFTKKIKEAEYADAVRSLRPALLRAIDEKEAETIASELGCVSSPDRTQIDRQVLVDVHKLAMEWHQSHPTASVRKVAFNSARSLAKIAISENAVVDELKILQSTEQLFSRSADGEALLSLAQLKFDESELLNSQDEYKEQIAVLDEIVRRLSQRPDKKAMELLAHAKIARCDALFDSEEWDDAIEEYRRFLSWSRKSTSEEAQSWRAYAYGRKLESEDRIGSYSAGEATIREYIDECEVLGDPDSQVEIARAVRDSAMRIVTNVYDEMRERGWTKSPYTKDHFLAAAGRYSRLESFLSKPISDDALRLKMDARVGRAKMLARAGNRADAIAILDQFLSDVGRPRKEWLRNIVSEARKLLEETRHQSTTG